MMPNACFMCSLSWSACRVALGRMSRDRSISFRLCNWAAAADFEFPSTTMGSVRSTAAMASWRISLTGMLIAYCYFRSSVSWQSRWTFALRNSNLTLNNSRRGCTFAKCFQIQFVFILCTKLYTASNNANGPR